MLFPFVSRARFDDMLREKNAQIGDRDRRIFQLEGERRMLCDKLCLLAIKTPVFGSADGSGSPVRGDEDGRSHPRLESGADTGNHEAPGLRSPEVGAPEPRRPSQIMRRMDRVAEARWLRKIHPAKAAEQERDEVRRQLDAAHREAIQQAKKSSS